MKRFWFRSVHEVAGTFVALACLLLVLLLLLASRAQRWFEPVVSIDVALPAEGSSGLRAGADVAMLGTIVGSVRAIDIDDEGRMAARIHVREDFARFLRADSIAVIKRTLGVAGDAFLEISKGSDVPLEPGGKLRAVARRDPTELLEEVVDAVGSELVPTVRELRHAVEQYTKLAEDADAILRGDAWADRIGATLTKLEGSLEEARSAFSGLQQSASRIADDVGQGAAKITDVARSVDGAVQDLPELITRCQQVVREVQGVLTDVREASMRLPPLAGRLEQEVEAVPGMVLQTRHAVAELERLVLALQRHWLIRGYVEPDPTTTRIAPGQVGGR